MKDGLGRFWYDSLEQAHDELERMRSHNLKYNQGKPIRHISVEGWDSCYEQFLTAGIGSEQIIEVIGPRPPAYMTKKSFIELVKTVIEAKKKEAAKSIN